MKIIIRDDLTPEEEAMIQALYSRSAESVEVHLAKLDADRASRFMDKYYVGYGHKSIADCGTTTMFIEGVSTLAAKAVQDWPLYSGQETSTRYIDMSKQPIVDPLGTSESKAVLDAWMAFYISNQERVAAHVRATHPRREDEDEKLYAGAVKARTFDILRGFLPAGITTQLSWHTNLRQAGDHLAALVHHPCDEIRGISIALKEGLTERYKLGFTYSVSGTGADANVGLEKWAEELGKWTYPRVDAPRAPFESSITNRWRLQQHHELFAKRPRGGVLPHFLADLGQLSFDFLLDFGSFRDIQRHRNGVCRMPLLDTTYEFEPWYLAQLDPELKREAHQLIEEQTNKIWRLAGSEAEKQYYCALGFRVPVKVTYALPAAVYVMEIRSGKMVHPTLRRAVHEHMVKPFRVHLPEVRLHIDESPSDWDVRRGGQTITERK